MDRAKLPLNALRAFEASARHLSFTRAAAELCVTQGAVSHQVAGLERRFGMPLFRRLPRGLALTDEGAALVPAVAEAFDGVSAVLDLYEGGRFREVLTLGAVGTFAVGWLLERLDRFISAHPTIDLRLSTHNNRIDLAGEGLDLAIRYGDGAWHGIHAEPILDAPLAPLCAPQVAARLQDPEDLAREVLLRSYRADEWPRWFEHARTECPVLRGPVFDSSALMVDAAISGRGVALAPPLMFQAALAAERLVQPYRETVPIGRYWLTRLISRRETEAMAVFREWLLGEVAASS